MRRSVTITCCILVVVLYLLSYTALQRIRVGYLNKPSIGPSFVISPIVLKLVAGEFKGLFSDYALIEAASIVGQKGKITEDQWDTIGGLYRQTMALDPYFEQSCYLIQGTLPWLAKRYDLTINLLEDSKKHRYWDWKPGFFIGFDYFYFLKDNFKASQNLMDASSVYNAPPAIATFAARLAQESGKNQLAISFLEMMLSRETDPDKKIMLLTLIQAHKAIDIIEKAIDKFREFYSKNPETLQDLVEKGILKELPENPYGGSFKYDKNNGSLMY